MYLFLEYASLLGIYVYHFTLLVSFYAYIFLDALLSDLKYLVWFHVYILAYVTFMLYVFVFFHICILFESDNSFT